MCPLRKLFHCPTDVRVRHGPLNNPHCASGIPSMAKEELRPEGWCPIELWRTPRDQGWAEVAEPGVPGECRTGGRDPEAFGEEDRAIRQPRSYRSQRRCWTTSGVQLLDCSKRSVILFRIVFIGRVFTPFVSCSESRHRVSYQTNTLTYHARNRQALSFQKQPQVCATEGGHQIPR